MSDRKNRNGLGDAIRCAERHIGGEPFAVLIGDSITKSAKPCTKQLIETFNRYQKLTVKRAQSNLAITGRYILAEDIFDKIDQTKP